MCMACGLLDHSGGMKQYARNSSNSRDAMENAYTTVHAENSPQRQPRY